MIYLLREIAVTAAVAFSRSPRCPVGQLDQPLIQGTTPNYATREKERTQRRPAAVIHISLTDTLLLFLFCILVHLPSAVWGFLSSPRREPGALWASQAVWLRGHRRMVAAMLR